MTILEKVLEEGFAGKNATAEKILRHCCVKDFGKPADAETCAELHKIPNFTNEQSLPFCTKCWNQEI